MKLATALQLCLTWLLISSQIKAFEQIEPYKIKELTDLKIIIDYTPAEIWILIFHFLDFQSQNNFRLTSKKFYDAIKNEGKRQVKEFFSSHKEILDLLDQISYSCEPSPNYLGFLLFHTDQFSLCLLKLNEDCLKKIWKTRINTELSKKQILQNKATFICTLLMFYQIPLRKIVSGDLKKKLLRQMDAILSKINLRDMRNIMFAKRCHDSGVHMGYAISNISSRENFFAECMAIARNFIIYIEQENLFIKNIKVNYKFYKKHKKLWDNKNKTRTNIKNIAIFYLINEKIEKYFDKVYPKMKNVFSEIQSEKLKEIEQVTIDFLENKDENRLNKNPLVKGLYDVLDYVTKPK